MILDQDNGIFRALVVILISQNSLFADQGRLCVRPEVCRIESTTSRAAVVCTANRNLP